MEDLIFQNKEPIKEVIKNSNEDETTKKAAIFALEHEKLTKDVINFAKEEEKNPSDEKTKIDKGVDIAFNNKEDVEELINTSKDENTKKVGKLALKNKKLTKDVINFAVEENNNPSDQKTQINKGLDIVFDNKKAVSEIIDESEEDKKLKKIGKIALEDKNLTKDVVNFALDEGKELSNDFNEFSKNKKNLKTSDYFKFASKKKKQINKAFGVAYKNKKALQKMNDNPKTNLNLALNHMGLTTGLTDLALRDDGKLPEKIEEFSKNENKDVFDCAKFICNNHQDLSDAAKILNNNKGEVKDIINTCIEDREYRESLNDIVDNYDLEGLAAAVEFGAGVVNFVNECNIF